MPLYLLLFHKDNEFFGLIGQYRRKAVNIFSLSANSKPTRRNTANPILVVFKSHS